MDIGGGTSHQLWLSVTTIDGKRPALVSSRDLERQGGTNNGTATVGNRQKRKRNKIQLNKLSLFYIASRADLFIFSGS